MMGYKLCVLLLLSSYAVAQQDSDNNEQTSCQLASRFKLNRKYLYHYTTESRNGVVGTANLRNGPKVFCKVEIEVPQMCKFIMRTTECALSEVSVMDPQGQPVYRPAPGSEAFRAAMEKNSLRFSMEHITNIQLYPEEDEPVNILNIKRGIISALMVPLMEEGQSMSTVHGQCLTDYRENARKDIATDVTLSRDLSQCSMFYGRKQTNSPLALLKNLHHPISKLITSAQDCNYQFDNKGKQITSAMCTEKHIYLPFSHEDNGISSVVTQELIFQNSKRTNSRIFDVDVRQSKPLHFENPDDKAPVQTKDAALSTLQDLVALAGTDQGQKRTSLFHKLVSNLRALRNETLSQTVTEMMDKSVWLTWQALLQCGTPECTSAILQSIWSIDGVSLEVDALVYGLSLLPNPDAARVRDMLSMAQYKQSKAIMYALANTVKNFHKGGITPEVTEVSRFMETLLNDCSGEVDPNYDGDFPPDPQERAFLVLRVVGVMGKAMQAVSPGLISSVLKCAQRTDIPLSNQKSAIQALRLMDINDEIRNVLKKVYKDFQSPVEKRQASYLILMKNPDFVLVKDIVHNLENLQDTELKTFVSSHINHIRNSNDPETQQLREYVTRSFDEMAFTEFLNIDHGRSHHYKIDTPLGSVQSNVIFDSANTLPKEVMLETTLKVLDYNHNIFEVGIEGTGFEPTIDGLFGERGFFDEPISKAMYWAGEKSPILKNILERIKPNRNRMKRQTFQDVMKDVNVHVQTLVNYIREHPNPEATAYLRLLGNEIGYMKTSEMTEMAGTLFMYFHVFTRVLPYKAFSALTSSTDNDVFAHYIFMENTFSLPTASGFPLKFSLAGVFAPGAKGGMTFTSKTGVLSFMPSVGLEFITQMGVHIPDYVDAGLEMHTNMYHESSLNAKFTINSNQIKLAFPAPKSNTQLFSISNKVLSVSSGQTKIVPSLVEDRADSTDCQPLVNGLKLCTIVRYSNATSMGQAPYYPLTGETTFAVEIQPTGEISEYTATITTETLREGREGRRTGNSLKLTLKAEGDDSTEATVSLKYNKNVLTTEVTIPDYDVETGIKMAVSDKNDATGMRMRGVTIDITNKNIPQLTLVGRMRLQMMKDAILQLQMIIPSLKTETSVTATLKKDEDMVMNIDTVIKLPETSYEQKTLLKYDADKFEVELKSDLNSEIQKLIPNVEDRHRQLQQLIDDILDQRVAKTDMKLRHIVSKGIVAGNIWLDKLTASVPGLANLRSKRSLSDLTLPPLPEKLFLQSDSLFRYQFNKEKMVISLALPLGGKKSKDLNIPTTLSTPTIDLPAIGLYMPANDYPLPTFTVPPSLDFTIPLLGLAEASTKIKSNLYNWEGSISGGNNTVDVPSYIAQYKAIAQSPINLLSYKLEGTGMMSGRADDSLKYLLNNSFSHSLIDTSFSVLETLRVTNKLNALANYKMEAYSPLGLEASLYYSAQSASTLDSSEVTGDGSLDGKLKIGSLYTNTSYTHNYNVHPLDREGRGESILRFDSPFIQVHNMINGAYANSELNIVSKTNAQNDALRHVAELKYKDSQLTLKCNAAATAMGKSLSNKVELGVSSHMAILRIESQADDDKNRAYSLITGSVNSNGLELNSEGSLTFDAGRGLHKASLMVGRNGLTTSGTNSIQCSPVTFENIYNGAIDNNGASISSKTKAMADEIRGELNIDGKITAEEASLKGVFRGNAHDANTRNNMNFVLNRRALTFTSNSMGTLKRMKTENSHTLTLTLWTLNLRSKTDNFFCEDIQYKHDVKVDMKPFVMSLDMTNDLRFYDVTLNNEGHTKLEPIKVDLSGSMKGAYGRDHNIKHTYEISYNDMAGTMKCSTSGNVMDAQMSHDCELEFAGFSSRSKCEARLNSEPLRFDSTIRAIALPFSLTVDALVNSDGEMNLNGKHTGQLYSKLLVKAEPLALAYSHDSRVSTTHMLPSGESSTHLDNKFDALLIPNEQFLTWMLKSKLNDHAYNQDIRTYNNPEKTGFEYSGTMSTDVFSKMSRDKRSVPEIQEFSMSGFLKYDKNTDCHIINIPFIKSFPVAFQLLKDTLVQGLELLQQSIDNLDITQLITNFREKLDRLPMQVSDFMKKIDLENKVSQVKAKLDYLAEEFAITMDDLEIAMNNLRGNLERTVMDIATKIRNFILEVKDYIQTGRLADKITNIFSQIGNQLSAFNEKYKIKPLLLKALDAIQDIISQIDLQKLTEGSAAWLRRLDSRYRILENIKEKLSDMKQAIENFDIKTFLQNVKDYLISIDVAQYVEQLSYQIPSSEIQNVLESMNDVIVNWIDEYEVPNKLNAVYTYIRDWLLYYDIDDKFKELMDQVIVLIKEFKIKETVQTMVNALKSIKFEIAYDKIMQFLHSVTNQLRAIDFRKSIEELNAHISSMVKSLKEFDYNAFVDDTNEKIAQLTNDINEQIKTYEIVQKLEAIREFFREVQSATYNYLEKLKNTKVADALKKLKNVIDTTFYNDIKLKMQDILEDMRQRILDMDIRDEMYIHLQRASESYSNVVAYISAKIIQLIDAINMMIADDTMDPIRNTVDWVLDTLKRAKIKVSTFTLPLTDLVIPTFTIKLNKLQEITIPTQISIPEITILNSYTIPALTIDFDEIKAKIIAIIDNIRKFEIQMPDPEEIFGDLKVLYLSELPDFTFPEITLSEIKFPAIDIPKLNLKEYEISTPPIPEIKLPEIPSDICVPVFGKLHGEFRVNSAQFTLVTTGKIENSTASPKNPQFRAAVTSYIKSPVEPLEYSFEATAQLEAPRMKKLQFTETVKATHMVFSLNHEGSLTLAGSSAEASAKTTAKATTQMYTADLFNNMALTLKNGITAITDTDYNHNLDIPLMETSSQATMKQKIEAAVQSDRITLAGETTGNGKWSIQDYSDEGTHKSNLEFNIDFSTAKLTLLGETDCKALKSKQTLTAKSVGLSHATVEARSETEVTSVEKSVTVLNGEANGGDLKIVLTASHDAELTGSTTGFTSHSLEFMARPFEIVLDVKNKVNAKLFFPLKLTGKVDLQNDYGVILNSDKQRACWFALMRFNQYKYNHNFTAENNEMDIFFHSVANGEANLDFLTVPLSIPEMTVPYLDVTIPEVRDLSLWDHAGFKTLLTSPQQSFDMNLKIHYYKSPEKHSFELYLEPFYNAISDNAKIVQVQFEQFRDKVVELLKDSYNQAKSQYIKHKIDTSSLPPRIFIVPGYQIPILNIEVSAFKAEMPAFSYIVPKEVSTPSFKVPALGFSVPSYTLVLPSLELPVIHVPESLSEMKLPTFTLPAIQNNIAIPAMGNLTCDFSLKSTVITLSANAGLYNQADITARFSASSASVFDIFNGKMDGTTSLTRKRGIKLATTVSLEHKNMEANHECAVSLTKRSMEASVGNTAKISLPFLNLEWNQELTGNTKTKPNIASKNKIKYIFNIPVIETVGEGNLDMNWALEALSAHVSLEASNKGKSDITIMDSYNFAGDLQNEATFYLGANGLRSTVTTDLKSNIDKLEKQKRSSNNNILQFDINENFALEVSLRRVFATVDYTSNNNVDIASFYTNGKHTLKGELDFVPLTSLKITMNTDVTQPSSMGHAGVIQNINLAISSEKQSFTWSGKEQMASFIHACDLLVCNDESEVRMDLTGSVEGHLAFLKSIKLPVYQKNLWDVLKFDDVTNMDNLQFLNITSSVVYTKTMEGQEYAIPSKLFENGITFSFPEITIAMPSWIKEIPHSIRNIDMQLEKPNVPDHFTLPPVISVPAFDVPFTTLHVEPFTIDPKDINIPKVITTTAFDIMLPGLPKMSVPSYDINIEYLRGKMSFLSFKMPQYEIIVSSFTLPKSIDIGKHTFSLNDIASQISNFELPTIVIPEQKIEIPEIALNLPASVFVPAFGSLSATLKVSSPVYNVSTTASVEKKDSSLVTSLNSLCTSTVIFLEYDLTGSATLEFNNEAISLNGKCNLIHSDVNVDWQHVYAQNLRVKRQTPTTNVIPSRHTLNVDITSPTFVDVSFRFASRKDGITASMSSPSSGFLGLNFQRRSPSQLYGKLFSRYLSTPDKDTDILTTKATLKNSQLNLQTSWNLEVLHDVIEGTKDRIPAMTDSVLKFINKYHTAHFGFDLNRGGMKLKSTVSNVIERTYHEFPLSFNTLQNLMEDLSNQAKDKYMMASDSLTRMRLQEVIDSLAHEGRQFLKRSEGKISVLVEAITKFLSSVKLTVPGSEEKLSIPKIVQQARRSVSRATDRAVQRFINIIEKIIRYIWEIVFTIPGTNVVVNVNDIMEKVLSVYDQLRESAPVWFDSLSKTFHNLFQMIEETHRNAIFYLKDENVKIASQLDATHLEIMQSSKQYIEEVRRSVAEYKDNVKRKVQEAYNSISVKRVNDDIKELIDILQSHFYGGLNEFIDLIRQASQSTAPYIKATNKKLDIEIPLPFSWKSFSEWPMQSRQ